MAESGKYDITVAVKTAYLADQSDPSRNQYVFAYTVTIRNAGTVAAPRVSRQPLLRPGESFEYTSGTHLATAVGTMRGTYQMMAEDGYAFDAAIPSFTLSVPRVLH